MRITAEDLLRRHGAPPRRQAGGGGGPYRRRRLPATLMRRTCSASAPASAGPRRRSGPCGARRVAALPRSGAANQGATLAEAGRLGEAIAALRRALALQPMDPVSLRNLGQALTAAGQAGAALEPLRGSQRYLALGAGDLARPWRSAAREAGLPDQAREAARKVGGPLAEQAGFLLAALGDGPRRPARRPPMCASCSTPSRRASMPS